MPARKQARTASRRSARSILSRDDATAPPLLFTPRRLFFTSGTGTHETQRAAMQRAMRQAGVADCNFVKVSSVIPPACEIVPRAVGLRMLRPGAITHAVIAEGETNEPHQRVTPAICWAQPSDPTLPGYMTEVDEDQTKGRSAKTATDEAGEALLTIIAERFGASLDAKRVWANRGRTGRVRIGRLTWQLGAVAASAVGPEVDDEEEQYAIATVLGILL
jgi:arginine decarboxylase